MKKLVFFAYAYDSNMQGSPNVSKDEMAKNKELYMKNIVVAAVSARKNIPTDTTDVAILTNIPLEEPYSSILDINGIHVHIEPFDEFNFGPNYRWGLAFYKLCALKKVLTYNYDSYLMMDTDTYTFSDFSDIWGQTKDYLMLYDIGHRPTVPNCRKFYDQAYDFAGIDKQITKYGGEFIAGNKNILKTFIYESENVFKQLKDRNFATTCGDEFIINIVADKMRGDIKNAAGYIARYWTNPEFYRVATNHIFDPISILHLPAEKECGIIRIYRYFRKRNALPSTSRAFKMLNVPRIQSKPKQMFIKIKRFVTRKFCL